MTGLPTCSWCTDAASKKLSHRPGTSGRSGGCSPHGKLPGCSRNHRGRGGPSRSRSWRWVEYRILFDFWEAQVPLGRSFGLFGPHHFRDIEHGLGVELGLVHLQSGLPLVEHEQHQLSQFLIYSIPTTICYGLNCSTSNSSN
jgi:hypothetical protein